MRRPYSWLSRSGRARPVDGSGGADVAAGEAILNKANIPTFAYPDTAVRPNPGRCESALTATSLQNQFLLDPDITFLNHGSYGACPKPVFEEYQRWQLELERQPVEFLGRRADELLQDARVKLGAYLNAPADSLVFVTNATWGVNVIIRSLDLDPGDEVLTTDHEYGANTLAWEWLLAKEGA